MLSLKLRRRPGRLRALLGLDRLARPAPYPTRGRLLIFIDKSPYGTDLSASLPQALGTWGFVDRIKLTLRRKYSYRGKQGSYFNAGCPASSTNASPARAHTAEPRFGGADLQLG